LKGVDDMHQKKRPIDYYTENWYAMLVAILKDSSIDNALENMGINTPAVDKKEHYKKKLIL
jgi:hypothetical protein